MTPPGLCISLFVWLHHKTINQKKYILIAQFLPIQNHLQMDSCWRLSCRNFQSLSDLALTFWMFQNLSLTKCKTLFNSFINFLITFYFYIYIHLFFSPHVFSFDSNHVHFAGTSGQNRPGQQGQHIYTEYQNLGPNNGLYGPFGGPKEGQRPTLKEPLVYIPVAGPDGNRVPLVKVC